MWGISSRRLRIWAKRVFGDSLSHSGICQLKSLIRDRVNSYREQAISDAIRYLVVDGLWGRYRGGGQGVVLVAIGVTVNGKAQLLDWIACKGEHKHEWLRLFRRLQRRGLQDVELVVSDGIAGLDDCLRWVWGEGVKRQLCLWHFQRDLVHHLRDKSHPSRRRFIRDYWEVFAALDQREAFARLMTFCHRWEEKESQAIGVMRKKQQYLLAHYCVPDSYRHRLRTTNLAENFFSHMQNFLRRFPGWIDEEHISYILGVFIISTNVFHNNWNHRYARKMPSCILDLNFNRIT